MKPKRTFLLALTFLLLFISSSTAFSEDVKDDVWVAEDIEGVGVIASVNGRITHGDRFRIRIEETKCQQGELLFSFYTTEDNKDILNLQGKVVEIKFNNEVINAKILSPQKFLVAYSAIFYLGFESIESVVSYYKDKQTISAELIDSEDFKASDYFDVLKNEWSLNNLESSLKEAQGLCRSLKSDDEPSEITTEYNKLLQLAEQGNPEAQYEVGVLYAKGKGILQDSKEAFKWFQLAADQGHAKAKVIIESGSQKSLDDPLSQVNTDAFQDGSDALQKQDHKKAIQLFRLAAKQGSAKAQTNLGMMHLNGLGTPKNHKEAAKWFRLAAERGNVKSQSNLGMMYVDGIGVSQDYKEAMKWFLLAAKEGNEQAQINLGTMYYRGEGIPQDYQEAVRWYRLAAKKGDAGAEYNLGWMYDKGEGVQQDYKEAVKWYQLSAEQGHAEAQYYLGWMYAIAHGVSLDRQEAFNWYGRSAKQGFAKAQLELGHIYGMGHVVDRNFKEAVKWYRLASEQGLAEAQYYLASRYDLGQGVLQDYVLAHMWSNLSGSQGFDIAIDFRIILEKKMTPPQIEKAQEMARNWKPKTK